MILVLSGTKDGREIVYKLLKRNKKVLATTATKYGGSLFKKSKNLKIISKRLNEKDMIDIIINNNIKQLVDATHPYAKEVSINAINASKKASILYTRYERPKINYKGVEKLSSFKSAAKRIDEINDNILLTIGSNHLEKFKHLNKDKLYVRVLPTQGVVEKCVFLGFKPKKIIGLQGPFSKEFNKAIYKEYSIKYILTKDSGLIGGTKEKVQAAIDMGVKILLIKRPKMNYENIFYDKNEIINFLEKN
ncbi:MAG: cobalt-precorrin-6A reductase [Firmicutes bacterium]|nr:cobalt-precorrin-6A reductase [Bacillota bacterium]